MGNTTPSIMTLSIMEHNLINVKKCLNSNITIMLNVIMLNAIMLNVIMLSVIMLNAIMLNDNQHNDTKYNCLN